MEDYREKQSTSTCNVRGSGDERNRPCPNHSTEGSGALRLHGRRYRASRRRYDIQSIDTWGGKALSVHNVTSNAGTLILSDSCQMAKTSDSNKLVFYRYGNRYFLAEMWTANTKISRKMSLNQRQKELARNQQKSEVVLMASGKYR